MLDQAESRGGGTPGLVAAKRVAAWAGLGLVMVLVFSWYGAYRTGQAAWEAAQSKPKPSEVASAAAGAKPPAKTPAKAQAAPAQTSKVLVVSEVTLRKDPSTSSDPLRDLKKGEQLTLVGQVGPWYKVTDADGAVGWVSASDRYTKVVGK